MKYLKRFYMFLLLKNNRHIDKGVFVFVFNCIALMLGRGVRIEWSSNSSFIVSDSAIPGMRHHFRHQFHGVVAYRYGLVDRAKQLGQTYFLNQIDFKDGDIFLDCGANVGDMKLYFHVNDINIEYIGFEPSPIEFECLKRNVSPSKVFNFGLWKNKGILPFYISSQKADSGFIEPLEYEDIIEVPTRRLEEFITESIKCLKLEAEGGEPEVLVGIGDKLDLIEYIAADLGPERGIHAEETLIPVTNFLLSRGFVLQDYTATRGCALYRNTKFDSLLIG